MSIDDWKTFVKTAVRSDVFLQLQVELLSHKKTNHVVYHLFKTSDYFFSVTSYFSKTYFQSKNQDV